MDFDNENCEVISGVIFLTDYLNVNGKTKVFSLDNHVKNSTSKAPIWARRNMSLTAFIKKFPNIFLINNQYVELLDSIGIEREKDGFDQEIINAWRLELDDKKLTEKEVGQELTVFVLPENDCNISVSDDPHFIDDWIEEHIYKQEVDVVGFDTETLISGQVEKTSIIQLSTRNQHLIVQINSMFSLPVGLVKLLEDGSVIKTGVAIEADCQAILKWFDSVGYVNSVVDLSTVAKQSHKFSNCKEALGLKTLTAHFLGYYVDNKGESEIKKSNWNAKELSTDQINYAITDSYLSLALSRKFFSQKLDIIGTKVTRQEIPKKSSTNNLTRCQLEIKEQEKRIKSIESRLNKWHKFMM